MLKTVLLFVSIIGRIAHGSPIAEPEPEQHGIVGGYVSRGVPYQVSVHKDGELWCSGTILSPNVILSVAHCYRNEFVNDSTEFSIRAGTLKPSTGGQVRLVTEIKIHPEYFPVSYDVSLLKLDASLDMTDRNVKTVKLVKKGKEPIANSIGIISGWGRLQDNGSFPDELMEARVKILDRVYCENQAPDDFGFNETMICAGYKEGGVDACQFDSGGPLVVKGKQVGMVSWGEGCALPDHPGSYTNLASAAIRNFIKSTLKEFSSSV